MIKKFVFVCLVALAGLASGCASMQPCGGMPCPAQQDGSY